MNPLNVTVENQLYPDRPEQMTAMLEAGPAGPIVMVNLLKFREFAQYPDGSDPHLTGREAYARYGAEVGKLILKHGGKILYVGDVSLLSLGFADPMWDQVALAQYPRRAALVEMAMSPAYQEIAVHRSAGLLGQLNIETVYSPAFAAMIAVSGK